jgi:hypothetical protein
MKKLRKDLKRMEVVCRMAERKALSGLYITYGIQSLVHCSTDPDKVDAMLISANSYPFITLEKIDGSKESYPFTIGN